MSAINQEDLAIVRKQNDLKLAKWWGVLNRWEWPKALPNPETAEDGPNSRRSTIMGVIEDRIGLKACLRDWNKKRMPGQEFDIWWDKRG